MFVAIQRELLPHQLSAWLTCFLQRADRGERWKPDIPAAVIKTGPYDVLAGISATASRFGLVYHHQPRCRCGRFSGWARPAASTSAAIASGTALSPFNSTPSQSEQPANLGAFERNEILYKKASSHE